MKTITEFSGFQVAAALKSSTELSTSGKTPEEISQAMAESYKLEGDKLKLFTDALDFAKGRPESLKRIVVLALAEGEKAPDKAYEKDGKVFLMEYFYVPSSRPKGRGRDRDERDGKGRGGKRGKGGKRGERGAGRRDERAARPRGERGVGPSFGASGLPAPGPGTVAPGAGVAPRTGRERPSRGPRSAEGGPGGRPGRPPREPRPPRAPRPPMTREKQDVSVEKLADGSYKIQFKPLAQSQQPAAAPATAAQASATPESGTPQSAQ